MKSFKKSVYVLLSLLVLLMISACGQEQQTNSSPATNQEDAPKETEVTYPEKEITLVVPFSAGGTNDTAARILAEYMTKHLGKTVVVENKPGSGGATQTTPFARDKADGYTLQFSAEDPFSTISLLNKNIKYSIDDFDFLGGPIRTAMGVAVHADSPYESMEDLIKESQESNKIINFAHAGVGSLPHFTGEVVFAETGITAQQIPFDGGGQALNALLGGDVDVLVTSDASLASQVEGGKVRVLAVTSGERSPFVDAPTLKELGYNVEVNPVMSVYGPAGLPDEVKNVMSELFTAIQNDAEFEKAINDMNLVVDGRSGDEVSQYYKSVYSVYEKVADSIQQ